MKRDNFRKLCCERLLLLDGATGTELGRRGLPAGVCPEQWVLDNPEVLIGMQREYREAGSDIVYACTFGANRIKLEEWGLQDRCVEINQALVKLSREAVGDGWVFGDLAPTGKFVEPFGDLPFEDAVTIYKEQVQALVDAGVDGFAIETMMCVQEARAALLAVRETCDLPALVSVTYGEDGRTLTGSDPTSALITLQALGADAVGCNCSTGPEQMLLFIQAMKDCATVPLVAKPNAGMPKLVNGETVFDMNAEAFASHVDAFLRAGVNIFGGCCGTGPAHIQAVRDAGKGKPVQAPLQSSISAVSSIRKTHFPGADRPVTIVGERINPTGKKKLQGELREGKFDRVRQYAQEQTREGAAILDVNMGLSGIDELSMMLEAIKLLSQITDAPLCIDTTDPTVMEAALRLYPGRALLNSISAETERIEKMLPVAAKYGAMFVLLPLTDDEIPPTCAGRQAVAEGIFEKASAYGFEKNDIVLDGLVMTVSAEPAAAKETLDLVQWAAQDWGINTILGLSNISFGLPEREWVNSAFLAMAIDRGLTCAIGNPMAETFMAIKFASDALAQNDPKLQHYVTKFSQPRASAAPAAGKTELPPPERAKEAVVRGDETTAVLATEAALAEGMKPGDVVDGYLIPAIQVVGELFDRKEYFLPQLMMSADAMRAAFRVLEPLLQEAGGADAGPTVIIATVKGDIHDIGKNLVALMLKNYGFQVIDLGKDVDAATIVQTAREHNARVVALSALMTTTMTEMQSVIDEARAAGVTARFIVGGAVVDQAYADEIGADGYAPDAIGAVRTAQKLSDQ